MLLRHAKSAWDDPDLADHERPLAPRGKRAAPLIGQFMLESGLFPELVITSTARRARKTVRRVLAVLAESAVPEERQDRAIYDEGLPHMQQLVAGLSPDYSSVMLVGHQPDLQELLEEYTGQPLPHPKFSTCAVAVLDFDVDSWKETTESRATLTSFMAPRMLSASS